MFEWLAQNWYLAMFFVVLVAVLFFAYRQFTREERRLNYIARIIDSGHMQRSVPRMDSLGNRWQAYEDLTTGLEMLYRTYQRSDGQQVEEMVFSQSRLFWYKFIYAKGGVMFAHLSSDSLGVNRSGLERTLRNRIDAVGIAARELISGQKLM